MLADRFATGGTPVLMQGLPAARLGDMCVGVGPPEVIALGSCTEIGGRRRAWAADRARRTIVLACPAVLIGWCRIRKRDDG
jgi:uncharacterized Zn-binding protein involved in type VI secretion